MALGGPELIVKRTRKLASDARSTPPETAFFKIALRMYSVISHGHSLTDAFSILSPPVNVAVASGTVINYNTIEEFKQADKKALFAEFADKVDHRWPQALPLLTLLTDMGFV